MRKVISQTFLKLNSVKNKVSERVFAIRARKNSISEILRNRGPERNRLLILFFTGLFLLDYLLFCFHVEHNPLKIFPRLPVLENMIDIEVYLPALDGASSIEEKRSVPADLSEKGYVHYLFNLVKKGSVYDNTSPAVPADLIVKDIFIYEEDKIGNRYCIINIHPVVISPDTRVIKGSEELFRNMVEKTVMRNIPEIDGVYIMERGIPGKRLWDL